MKSHHGIWVLMNHYRTSTNQVLKTKKTLNPVIPDLNRLLVKSKKRHKAKPSKDFVESCC